MSTVSSDVIVTAHPNEPLKDEGDLDAQAQAGMIVEETATGYTPHATAAEVAFPLVFITRAFDPNLDKGDTIAAGERVQVAYPVKGTVVEAIIDESEDIQGFDKLVSAGDGRFRELDTAGGDDASAAVLEVVAGEAAVTGVGEQARVKARVI